MNNTITTVFTDEYKQQATQYAELLTTIAKQGSPNAEERVAKTFSITESYYEHAEQHMDADVLEKLADLILLDELTDTHPDKMAREEYPIMSETQQDERYRGEVNFKWAQNVDTDNVDHTVRTRDNMRNRRTNVGTKNQF